MRHDSRRQRQDGGLTSHAADAKTRHPRHRRSRALRRASSPRRGLKTDAIRPGRPTWRPRRRIGQQTGLVKGGLLSPALRPSIGAGDKKHRAGCREHDLPGVNPKDRRTTDAEARAAATMRPMSAFRIAHQHTQRVPPDGKPPHSRLRRRADFRGMAWSSRGVPERRSVPPDRFRRPAWLWLVPILSLLLTGVAWHVTRVSTCCTGVRATSAFAPP